MTLLVVLQTVPAAVDTDCCEGGCDCDCADSCC